ncbi:MFS transporter [Alcaligenes aquatilis]|uniref:MFS transporter n=1 Tax=Alcaligenes aquatilis TaxID=323284 RepID=A0A3G2HUS8_9BURK|nr:MFS transporter [Alcaligenes aquatilis]AYN20912.1 MFS transporter [Alcaligenes aquatilis]
MTRFLLLMIALIMFPQVVETAYSPALPLIAHTYTVSPSEAGQTLSVYFIAFALGVLFWGWLCDRAGRRPAVLAGLTVYGLGCLLAVFSPNFTVLLVARMVSALGAAVGSIGVQTMLRDRYQAEELAKIFGTIGAALALSPLLGLAMGVALSSGAQVMPVFIGLLVLALLLLAACLLYLPETRPVQSPRSSLLQVLTRLLNDPAIWQSALLVALFNTTIFAFYQWAPFLLQDLGSGKQAMMIAGVLLAAGTLMGAFLNRRWLAAGQLSHRLIWRGIALLAVSAIGLEFAGEHLVFLLPAMLLALAYAVAIPNLLSGALQHYRSVAGMAGAVFGLMYSLLLGLGLALSAWWGDLADVSVACAVLATICLTLPLKKA